MVRLLIMHCRGITENKYVSMNKYVMEDNLLLPVSFICSNLLLPDLYYKVVMHLIASGFSCLMLCTLVRSDTSSC